MQLTAKKTKKTDPLGRKKVDMSTAPAISLTDGIVGCIRPGFPFRLLDVAAYCRVLAGTCTLHALIVPKVNGLISAPTITVHSTPEQLATTAFKARANEQFVEKAAATAIAFTLGHIISAAKFGTVTLQMDSAGTISSKVPATTQAYNTAAEALAAKVAADSTKIEIGYLAIAAKSGTAWTAITDDLTAASDLQTISLVSGTAIPRILTGAITPVALKRVVGTLSSTVADISGAIDDDIVLLATTNGSGALTNGKVEFDYRPVPMHGEVTNE